MTIATTRMSTHIRHDNITILPPLRCNLLIPFLTEFFPYEVPLDEITVFIDPLDGTREFVEGRLWNVSCLVGIARNSRVVSSAVGRPFSSSSEEDKDENYGSRVEWALLGDEDGAHLSSTVRGDLDVMISSSEEEDGGRRMDHPPFPF